MRVQHSTLARYGVLVTADLSSRGLAFLATLLIAREFSDAAFGHIGVATSVVTYALMASTCGLDVQAVRKVAQQPSAIGGVASTVMALRGTLSLAAYAVLIAVCTIVPQLRDIWPLIALFGLTLFTGSFSLIWVPQALQRTWVLASANLSIGALYVAGVVLVIALHGPLWTIPISQVCAEATVAVALYLWLRQSVGHFERPAPVSSWLATLKESAPIGGSWLMRTVALGSDLLLLRLLYVNESSVGWYSGALRLFALFTGLSAIYFVILFPRLTQRHAQSPQAFRAEAVQSIGRVLALGSVATVAIALLAPLMLKLLFAPSFAGAVTPLRILGGAALAGVIGNHFRYMLLASGRQRTDLRNASVTALLHVIFKLLLIPLMGITGAALGMLLGEISVVLLGIWSTRTDLFLPRISTGTGAVR